MPVRKPEKGHEILQSFQESSSDPSHRIQHKHRNNVTDVALSLARPFLLPVVFNLLLKERSAITDQETFVLLMTCLAGPKSLPYITNGIASLIKVSK
jgi:hypothetical protein